MSNETEKPGVDFSKPLEVRGEWGVWHDVTGIPLLCPKDKLYGVHFWYEDGELGHYWADPSNDLRNKPETKYRPYREDELRELRGRWIRHREWPSSYMITAVVMGEVRISSDESLTPSDLFRLYLFDDGPEAGQPVAKVDES